GFDHRFVRALVPALGAGGDVDVLAYRRVGAAMRVHAPAVRVELVAARQQLLEVIEADRLVAAFPDQDAGVVAEVDEHVTERRSADLPRLAGAVALAIHAGLIGDDAEPIGGADHRHRAGAVAPAD